MKIGFSILSHKKPDLVFDCLITQLKKFPEKYIAIHHDFSKAETDFTKYLNEDTCIINDYVSTAWSHVNNIKAILKTFECLHEKNCDWYVTLSANCYPIKDVAYILDFLEYAQSDVYMEHNNVNTDHFDFYTYFRKAIYFKKRFSIPFLKRNGTFYWKTIWRKRKPSESFFNEKFIPYHGSDWFMINRKAMAYILENKAKVMQLISFFEDVNSNPDFNVCPPEMLFQSLLANNNALRIDQNNYRYINWTGSVDWHPNTLTEEHFETILQSNALFARKLEEGKSTALVDLLNRFLEKSSSLNKSID